MYDNYLKSIDVYLNDQDSDYAIMLDGSWGSGKTYFVKENLIPYLEKNKEKRIIYVSLFGMNDINELLDNIMLCVIDLRAKEATQSKDFLSGCKSGFIKKVDASFMANSLRRVLSFVPKGNEIKGIISDVGKLFVDFKKYIFVFDDFERSCINFNVLLGLFSEIINQNQSKVIVVCNEQEILNSSQGKKYKKFKEKVFGVNIKFNQDIYWLFDDLVDSYCENEEVKLYIQTAKNRIIDMFHITKSNNIRTLIFSVKRFAELYERLCEKSVEVKMQKEYFDELLNEIVLNVFAFSLHWKKYGVVRELKEFEEYWLFDEEYFTKEPDYKYSFMNLIKVRKPINEYICNLSFQNVELEKVIDSYYAIKENDVSEIVNKVNEIMLLDDELASKNLREVLYEIQRDEYKLIVYPKILDKVFVLLRVFEYSSNEIAEFKCNVKNNVIKRYGEYKYMTWSTFPCEDKDARQFLEELYKTIVETSAKCKEKEWKSIFKSDDRFLEKFSEYMQKEKGYFTPKGVFSNVDVSDVTERILNLNNREIVEFFSTLRLVYDTSISNLKEFYADDAWFFRDLRETLISKLAGDNNAKTKKYLIEYQCIYLQQLYEHLM